MNEKALLLKAKDIANNFLLEEYGFTTHATFSVNRRMTSALGRLEIFDYFENDKDVLKCEVNIDYNFDFLKNADLESLTQVTKHEAIHYACLKMKNPFNDGDPYFENELLKHNVVSHASYDNIQDSLSSYHKQFEEDRPHELICISCSQVFKRFKNKPKSLIKYKSFEKYSSCCQGVVGYRNRNTDDITIEDVRQEILFGKNKSIKRMEKIQ